VALSPETAHRALVLRALGLGDLLTGVPAMRALARALPDHDLTLATPLALEPLVRLAGVADRLLPTSGLEPPAWTGSPPDVAVNLHGRGPQSHRLLADLRPRRLVAFGCPEAGHSGPPWDAGEHEVRRWQRLVRTELGGEPAADDLLLEVPAEAPPVRGAVVLHPGAAYPSRRWPAERFAGVARWAAATGWPVVVTGGGTEAALAQRVADLAGLPDGSVLAGRTDLTTLAALVAAAGLVVCGDTGLAHLASAYRTPSVVLFGPVSPSRWGPPADGPHTVLWKGDGTGDPWGDDVDPALLRLDVEEVVAAAEVRLAAPAAGRTTPASA
jgi:ADP-heptose:LPS heptosyltransferase